MGFYGNSILGKDITILRTSDLETFNIEGTDFQLTEEQAYNRIADDYETVMIHYTSDGADGLYYPINLSNLQGVISYDFISNNSKITASNSNNRFDGPTPIKITKNDLDSDINASLGKADTALQAHQEISGKEDKNNKVTAFNSPTNAQYPSAKLVNDSLAMKITMPAEGTIGQVLTKTANGIAWDTPSSSGESSDAVFVEVMTDTLIHEATYTDFYGWKINGETSNESDACLALFRAVKSGTPCSLLIYEAQSISDNRQLFTPTGTIKENGGSGGTFATFAADGNEDTTLTFTSYSIYIYYYYINTPNGPTQEEGGIGDVMLKDGLLTSQNEKNTWNGKLTPPSGGSAGQVLTKTASGYAWASMQGGGSGLPEGGEEGQVIMMGENNAEWTALATVATSGSYNDLSNKPTIPTVPVNVSAFNNDAGYLTTHQSLTAYRTSSAQDVIDATKINKPITGNTGQVLTKTANGEAWDDITLEISVLKDGTRTYVLSTDYDKIEAAWATGRAMTLLYENRRYYPMRAGDGSAQQDNYTFYTLDPGNDPIWEPETKLHVITLVSPGSAVIEDITFEKLSNKVTSISSLSTDTKYPSAKAVYDFVDTTMNAYSGTEFRVNASENANETVVNKTLAEINAAFSNNKMPMCIWNKNNGFEILRLTYLDNTKAVFSGTGSGDAPGKWTRLTITQAPVGTFTRQEVIDNLNNNIFTTALNTALSNAFLGVTDDHTETISLDDVPYEDVTGIKLTLSVNLTDATTAAQLLGTYECTYSGNNTSATWENGVIALDIQFDQVWLGITASQIFNEIGQSNISITAGLASGADGNEAVTTGKYVDVVITEEGQNSTN